MKRKTAKPFFTGLLAMLMLASGCGKQAGSLSQTEDDSQPSLTAPPEVTSRSEEGFHDLVFYIQENKKLADGAQSFRASGLYKGQTLGLDVVVGADWKASSGKDLPLTLYSGKVTFRSVGAESDAFVKVLDELYGTKQNPVAMKPEQVFAAISLGSDPRKIAEEPQKIKLFYESTNENEYAEFYANIDSSAKSLMVAEKDESYRPAVIRALGTR